MKILVAEDQPMILRAISRQLQHAGFEVLQAYDGEKAMRMYDTESPDMVVTDLLMPFASGLEVISHIRKKSSRTPILVLSTVGNDSVIIEAFKNGADDYVKKPTCFYIDSEGHGFNPGFGAVFHRFPYEFSWGGLLGDSL